MKKIVVLIALIALIVVPLSACGDDGTGDGDQIRIGISMESLESQFLVMNHRAMLDMAEELGAEAIVLIAEGDATRQNQQIEDLIAQGVDAIIAFPNDGAAIASAVRMAQDQGIPFIMNNRAIQSDDVVPELQVLSNNEQMAYDVVAWFGERAREEGETYQAILLVGSLADQGAVYRQLGHLNALEEFSDVIELVAEIPTEWNHDMALSGLQSALQANPDANLIITPSDFLFPPIRSALEQVDKWAPAGAPNHVSLLTFDGDEVGMQYLVDGFSTANAAQDPVFTGRTCVEWAVRMANGEEPPALIIFDPGIIATEDNWEDIGPTIWSWEMVVLP